MSNGMLALLRRPSESLKANIDEAVTAAMQDGLARYRTEDVETAVQAHKVIVRLSPSADDWAAALREVQKLAKKASRL